MSAQALRLPPGRTPEREQLAEAIERHVEAQRQLAANESAQAATQEAIYAARHAVEQTAAAIEEAKKNAATHLTAVAMGTAGAAPLSLKQTRLAAQDAEDALEAAKSANAALEEQHKAAERELQYASLDLDKCVRDVIRLETGAAVSELLKQAETAQADLINRRVVLRHLLHADQVAEADKQAVASFLRNNALPGTFGDVEYTDWGRHPACEPWRHSALALRKDADAALPI
jgi:3-dehydroquinate synthetase